MSSDENIIIKEADKEGAFVKMNSDNYKKMSETIPNNNVHYTNLKNGPQKKDLIKLIVFPRGAGIETRKPTLN